MSYVTDFYLADNSTIVLPLDFFNTTDVSNDFTKNNNENISFLMKEKEELSSLNEDVMTLKQYKRLKEIENELTTLDKNNKNFYIKYKNKYGFNCLESNVFSDVEIFLDEDREKGYALIRRISQNVESICVYTSGSDNLIKFVKTDNGYVLKELNGTKSNHGWVREKIEELIYKFSLTATIKDAGNEEDGYENEDGIDEEKLDSDAVFINGIRQK